MDKSSLKSGFTMVEMLVVLGIIAILAGATIVGFGKVTQSAQRAKAQETVSNAATALSVLLLREGRWPTALRSKATGDGIMDETVARVLGVKKLMSVSLNASNVPQGTDRCGIVDPWAVAVLKRSMNAQKDAVVPSGGTVKDHTLRFAIDLDGDGITEVTPKDSGTVRALKVRASAAVWCAGADGKFDMTFRGDDVFSWQKSQEVEE